MKKLQLSVSGLNGKEILSRKQLKSIYGGNLTGSSGSSNGCSSLTKDQCLSSVTCYDSDGHSGSCGWTKYPSEYCSCAVAYIGSGS